MDDDTYNAIKILITCVDARIDIIADEKDKQRRQAAARAIRNDVLDLVTAIGICTSELINAD